MHFIQHERVPCWYHLSSNEQGLFVHMRREAAALVREIVTLQTPIVEDLRNSLRLGDFSFRGVRWGFMGNAFWIANQSPQWETLALPYPNTRHRIGEILDDGKRQELFAASATLNVLTKALNNYGGITDTPIAQPMTLEITTRESDCGGSLTASFSLEFWQWHNPLSRPLATLAELAMMQAYKKIWDKDGTYDELSFQVRTDGCGQLHLTCPGYGVGLDPDHSPLGKRGYGIIPHNTDSPHHQLTLLAGLAKLCELYIAEQDPED